MFGGDPFGDPFGQMRQMHRHMDNMMNAMMQDTFGLLDRGFMEPQRRQQQQMIGDGRGGTGRHANGAVAHRMHPMDDMMLNPFGGFGFGGGLFGGMMQQMNHLQNHAMNDPNSIVFTQSTVISHDGSGAPRIVQSSTRKAGDVKETRRQVRNGNEHEEITVGHTIGDRSHVIEKKRDKDGRMRSQQRFINLDEDDAEQFNHEFKSRAAHGLGMGGMRSGPRYHTIDNGNGRRQAAHSSGAPSNSGSTPIVEIPDDDEDEVTYAAGRPSRSRGGGRGRDEYYNNPRDGPTIREISEEEADMSNAKRRKGLFGKFFNANDE